MRKKPEISPLTLQAVRSEPSASDRKKAQILEAVVAILSERGLDELTFESVGKATGMARSHVVYYFENRDALVLSALRFVALSAGEIIDTHLGQADDWEAALERYVEGNFEWMRRHPSHATIYLLMYYLARLNPKYKQVHSAIRQAGADRITAILEKRKTGRPSKALAKAIQAVITGALVDAMTTATKGGLEQRLAETQQAVSALIRGSK